MTTRKSQAPCSDWEGTVIEQEWGPSEIKTEITDQRPLRPATTRLKFRGKKGLKNNCNKMEVSSRMNVSAKKYKKEKLDLDQQTAPRVRDRYLWRNSLEGVGGLPKK